MTVQEIRFEIVYRLRNIENEIFLNKKKDLRKITRLYAKRETLLELLKFVDNGNGTNIQD